MEIFDLIFWGFHILGFYIGIKLVESGFIDGTLYLVLWALYIFYNFIWN